MRLATLNYWQVSWGMPENYGYPLVFSGMPAFRQDQQRNSSATVTALKRWVDGSRGIQQAQQRELRRTEMSQAVNRTTGSGVAKSESHQCYGGVCTPAESRQHDEFHDALLKNFSCTRARGRAGGVGRAWALWRAWRCLCGVLPGGVGVVLAACLFLSSRCPRTLVASFRSSHHLLLGCGSVCDSLSPLALRLWFRLWFFFRVSLW